MNLHCFKFQKLLDYTEKKLCMWGVDVWLVFQWHLIKVCDVKIQID